MTNLETNDLFVITRGYEYHSSGGVFSYAGLFGNESKDDKPRYDRSDNGLVFMVLEACGPVVACRCVWADPCRYGAAERLGQLRSLNLAEIEVMPVTPAYLKALQGAGGAA